MRGSEARRFWDRRAEKHAFHAVDNRVDEDDPALDRFWSEGEEDLDRLLDGLGAAIAPSDEVVEIGCGVGRLTRVLAARAASVRALDVSERMLDTARRYNPELPNADWLLGDGESLAGVESDSADAVVSHVVFQHIPDPAITLGYVREIGRVLRPGGWAAFQISNDPSVHRPRDGRRGPLAALRGLLRRDAHWYRDPHWLGSHVELSELREAAEAGSMEVERTVGEGTQFCLVLTRRLAQSRSSDA